jgi:hypothetical protein
LLGSRWLNRRPLVLKLVQVLSVAEHRLLPLVLAHLLEELIEPFEDLRVVGVYPDLKLDAKQDSFLIDAGRHPIDPGCLIHVITLLLDSVLLNHQVLVGLMRILGLQGVLAIFQFEVDDFVGVLFALFE